MPPARSPDGPVHALAQPLTLEAALRDVGRTLSSADVDVVRTDILCMVNAVIREQENPKKIDGALATMASDLQLGIQCLDLERGRDAVYKALRPTQRQGETSTRLHQLLALGRAQRIEKVTKPLQALIERNTVRAADDSSNAISKVVHNEIFDTTFPPLFLTSAQRKALRQKTCSTYADVHREATAIAALHRVLDVADYLGIDQSSIRGALEPGIESGLKHQISELPGAVSYLEIGVFCAVATRQWKIKRLSPLTLPRKAAALFLRDMRKGNFLALRQSYEKHLEHVFGRKHAPIARVLLGECLEALQTRFVSDRELIVHERETHAEFYVPVHQFSGDAMRSLYHRDRITADRVSNDD
ncbi:MAG: hypothetical protein G01um101425_302 [Candidatus Peregrinibacteria bacterium Gr01-1014_25]|nr:MAG: hypothetical protein G01um101425_302 [Candidatus Peregrinibacteria bacterium Gr01-1014_25]